MLLLRLVLSRKRLTMAAALVNGEGQNGHFSDVPIGQSRYQVFERNESQSSVAIEKIKKNKVGNEADIERIRKLDHPYVVKLLTFEFDEEFCILTLELCAGNLEEYCEGGYRGPSLDPGVALIHMADGLCYIHQEELVHGNIKPRNILISKPDSAGYASVKISDIRLATMDAADYSADVFALGCVFYYFLTRRDDPFGDFRALLCSISSGTFHLGKLAGHMAKDAIDDMIVRKKAMIEVLTKLLAIYVKVGEKELGKGGYGAVFQGKFGEMQVAIKTLKKEDQKSGRECRIMMKLDHPNVVKLLYASTSQEVSNQSFVLELCAATLQDYISGKYTGPMPDERSGLVQMARGVGYIHSQQHVHRDIKPANILISIPHPSKQVLLKISDFGFSRMATASGKFSGKSGILGTLRYMAPEYLNMADDPNKAARLLTYKVDIFSLGIVFCCYLTKGFHPFCKNGIVEVQNVLNGNHDLAKLAEHHKEHYLELIGNMINKDPGKRFGSDQVLQELVDTSYGPSQTTNRTAPTEKEVILESSVGRLEINKKVLNCSFHPVGTKLACASKNGVYIYNCTNPSTLEKLPTITTCAAHKVQWNRNGAYLAAGYANGTLTVWDENGSKKLEIAGHQSAIRRIAWCPFDEADGCFATGSWNGTIKVWTVQKPYLRHSTNHITPMSTVKSLFLVQEYQVKNVIWTAAKQLIFCSKDGKIKLWNIKEPAYKIRALHRVSVQAICWDSENQLLASCSLDKTLQIWKVNDQFTSLDKDTIDKGIYCMDWQAKIPSGRGLIASGRQDHKIDIFSFEGEKLKRLEILKFHKRTSNGIVIDVRFSPDGQYLAALDNDGQLVVWSTYIDPSSGGPVFKERYRTLAGNGGIYEALAWNTTSNRLAVANGDSNISNAYVIEFRGAASEDAAPQANS